MNFDREWTILDDNHSDLVYVKRLHHLCGHSEYHLTQILDNRHSSHGNCDPYLLIPRCNPIGALHEEEDFYKRAPHGKLLWFIDYPY